MRRVLGLFLIMLLMLCACGQNEQGNAPVWQDQYDLGVRYLAEGNYEKAIIAFTSAIEIDPKQAEAYKKLAETYVAMGDTELACKALEDGFAATGSEDLQTWLSELTAPPQMDGEREDYFDADGKLSFYTIFYVDPDTGFDRNDTYDPNGTLQGYTLYHYSDDGLTQFSENYSSTGELLGSSVVEQDEDGRILSSKSDDGRENRYVYDEKGEMLGWDNYDNGVLAGYARFEGDETVYYDTDGNRTGYH